MKIIAVVPSAGIGKRFGSNKTLVSLAGKPVLAWTLGRLQDIGVIDEIVPVLKDADMEECARIVEEYGISKVKCIVAGGDERQVSVYNGLKSLPKDTDVVIIHDGVRPFVTASVMMSAIDALERHDGAVVAVPLKDTIKEVDKDSIVIGTPRRDHFWAVQTPQVFRYDVIMKAYEKADFHKFASTDDSALVEKFGGKINIIPGSYNNIKITTPEDLYIAEMFIEKGLIS